MADGQLSLMIRRIALAGLLALLPISGPALAQGTSVALGTVVPSCGSAAYTAGASRPITVDTTGQECSGGTVKTGAAAFPSVQDSGTIAVTDTFQSVMTLNTGRNGCIVLNNATHRQWVYNGTTPTKAAAFPLESATANNAAGGSFVCSIGTGTVSDQIWITGTAGDTFVAREQ